MADDDEAALVLLEELAQPHDRVGIEVVGGLVEDHRLGIAEQDAGELDAAPLAARQRAERLAENAVGETQVARDGRRLRFSGVPAEGVESVGEPPVRRHGLLGHRRIGAAHVDRRALHVDHDLTEATSIEDARAGELLRVAGARILRKVADLARARDGAARGLALTRESPGHRGLAGAVAPHEPHFVALVDAERHVLHEQARPDADLEVLHSEHSECPFLWWDSTTPTTGGQPDSLTLSPAPDFS